MSKEFSRRCVRDYAGARFSRAMGLDQLSGEQGHFKMNLCCLELIL